LLGGVVGLQPLCELRWRAKWEGSRWVGFRHRVRF
jgi:hypothetical protein